MLSILDSVLDSANLLIEVRDARVPLLSAAAPLPRRFRAKQRIVVLNKIDRADPASTKRWTGWLMKQGETVLAASALSPGSAVSQLRNLLQQMGEQRKGRSLLRAAVIGLPNVGKSTLLNSLVGAARARTGDKPGITRGRQWVKLAPNAYLLDSPGAVPLADRIERLLPGVVYKLALCRILPEGRIEAADTVSAWLEWLRSGHTPKLPLAYFALGDKQLSAQDALAAVARSRSMLGAGGNPDHDAAARRIMVDFAAGKLGRFTLEDPPESPQAAAQG